VIELAERLPVWFRAAVCRTHSDPDLWFRREAEAEAVAVCRTCPVATLCAEYATARRLEFGVWGGLTETDRRQRRVA
jgi:WhiB family transcriptional regulator, redox-sensing transcriptional regulator